MPGEQRRVRHQVPGVPRAREAEAGLILVHTEPENILSGRPRAAVVIRGRRSRDDPGSGRDSRVAQDPAGFSCCIFKCAPCVVY